VIRSKARRIPCASLLLSMAAAFIFLCPSLGAHLEYNRAAIAAGEVWRLFSGHWVHYGFDHFFWDVLAFGFLGAACERRSRPRLFLCVTASALAISLSVWFGMSGMNAYRGLSGIDSALLVLLFMQLWSEARRSGQPEQLAIPAACLIAFVCKVSYELATGDTIFVKSLGSGMVGVPLAHVAGAAVGFLVGLATPGTRRVVLRWLKTSPAPEGFEPPVLDRVAATAGEWARTARRC
jgi:rhomboid family GlyGly-CTERM serine protease